MQICYLSILAFKIGSALIDDFSQLWARSRRLTSSRALNGSLENLSILLEVRHEFLPASLSSEFRIVLGFEILGLNCTVTGKMAITVHKD
jgi:hypothetical protein